MFVFWTTHPNLGFFVLLLFGNLFLSLNNIATMLGHPQIFSLNTTSSSSNLLWFICLQLHKCHLLHFHVDSIKQKSNSMNTDGNLKEAENNIEGQLQEWTYLIFVVVSDVCFAFQIFPELKVLAKIC